eukprot:5123266-Pyramimonas_sp.AAC.1
MKKHNVRENGTFNEEDLQFRCGFNNAWHSDPRCRATCACLYTEVCCLCTASRRGGHPAKQCRRDRQEAHTATTD